MAGLDDQGVSWSGTPEELADWTRYKKQKALRFVELGYSVAWYPDGDNWMDVYTPERMHAHEPEIRASVKFFSDPSQYGIDRGKISKLTIQAREVDLMAKALGRPYETVVSLFNYDRGLDVDCLYEKPAAMTLYEDVVRRLN